MPYEQPQATGVFNYYSYFIPGKERQLILFDEDIKGRKTTRVMASNGTGYLVDLQEQVISTNANNEVLLKPDKIVPVIVPKDSPVQNLEGKYRELIAQFVSSGYTNWAKWNEAQQVKSFALQQGVPFQVIQSWDIGTGVGLK